jgi:hypothetical protein
MRALLAGEDRVRFERLVSEVEQAVWEIDTINGDLAHLVAAGVAVPRTPQIIELTDLVTTALRHIDAVLASRSVLIDLVAPPALFVNADRDRLERLVSTALVVSASAVAPHGHIAIRCRPRDARTIELSIAPYCTRDPRAVIVGALAQSLEIALSATDVGVSLVMSASAHAGRAPSA